jgi:hypothetical protein
MMTGIGYLRRLGQGLRSMKHPTPMKLQEGKDGLYPVVARGVCPSRSCSSSSSCPAAIDQGGQAWRPGVAVRQWITEPVPNRDRCTV